MFSKTLTVVGTLLGLFLLFQLRSIVLLLFVAILFASTIRPLVIWLEAHKIKRTAAILLVYITAITLTVGGLAALLPEMLTRAQELANSQDQMLQSVSKVLQDLRIFAFFKANVLLPIPSTADMQTLLTQTQTDLEQQVRSYLANSFQAVNDFLVVFVMAFYWLTERDRIEDLILRMVPLTYRARTREIVNNIETAMGAYVRGQALLCVTMAALSFAGLTILGIPYALLLAIVAGLTEAIPMIGPILGAIPAILVALVIAPERALFVVLLYTIIQQLELNVLVPKMMERQVGLSPIVVILAIASGNLLAGIPGAIIAVPIAAVLQILVQNLIVEPAVQANQPQIIQGGILLPELPASVNVQSQGDVKVETPEPVTIIQRG